MIAYGDNDLVRIYDQKKIVEVEAYHVHPKYSYYNLSNDIALIRLKKSLVFSDAVQPACLPDEPRDLYKNVLTVNFPIDPFFKRLISGLPCVQISGWGYVNSWSWRESGRLSRYLKEGNTYDVSDDPEIRCKKSQNICVENRVDASYDTTCNGDSGEQFFVWIKKSKCR